MPQYVLSRFWGVTIDEVWIGELDLLTTYTHVSELQVITALSLTSTFLQITTRLSLFLACCVLNLPYVYDYITKLCRQQAEVTQNHENELVHCTEEGEATHRKYERLKLGGG
jgi:predicted transcriptional regulator